MKSELLAKSPMLALPLVALFLFLAVFGVAFLLVMRKKPAAYAPWAALPLSDGEPATTSDTDHGGVS